jgi:hypothetical protein
MSTATDTGEATRGHPFSAAIEDGDHGALVETLASEVVLHSAVTFSPFEGRDTVADVYAAVIESFEELEVVDEFSSGDTYVFFWRGRIEGRRVEGADRLRLDSEGKVREISVLGRPLAGLAGFLTSIGPRFALRRRGRATAAVLRLSARPIPPMFTALDPITRWMSRGRRRAA